MKAAFALNLSHDGIGLLRRTARGWLSIGEVSLDDPDLAEHLSYIRKTALALSPAGLGCKLIVPNSQILYTEVTAPGPDEAARRAQIARALDGKTPYKVADLVFDWRGPGPVVQVAVVARKTLEEAEAFASEHRFAPLSFVAIPEPGRFSGEPFFGPAAGAARYLPPGEIPERDEEPVRILGRGDPAPEPWTVPADAPDDVVGQAGADAAARPAATGEASGADPSATSDPEAAPLPPAPRSDARGDASIPVARSRPSAVVAADAGPATGAAPAAPLRAERPAAARAAAEPVALAGLGARIAERRAAAPDRGRLLPLAVAALLVAGLLAWLLLALWPADPVPEAAATQAERRDPTPQAAAPVAIADVAPAVASAAPAQPLPAPPVAAATIDAASDDLPPSAALPATGPAAAAETPPVPQENPGPARVTQPAPPPEALVVDPVRRYALTGVWTVAPAAPPAGPAPDRLDGGATPVRDAPATLAALVGLPAPAAGPEATPRRVPDPPPFAPPPRRDAEGRIVPTAAGVVTAEGVTLVAGRPPVIPPPRPVRPPLARAPDSAPDADPVAGTVTGTAAGTAAADSTTTAAPDETDAAAAVEVATIAVAIAPADATRPRPRPPGLTPQEEEAAPPPAAEAEPQPGTVPAAVLPADPALAGFRPRPPTPAVLARAAAAAEARAEAARAEAERAAALAAASPLAVASSRRPVPRPRDFSDAVAAALALAVLPEAAPAAAPQPAAAPASPPDLPEDDGEPELRQAMPDIPTTAAVSREATVSRAIRLNEINLIGVFGTAGARRALVRMPNGRYERVVVGDRLDGGRVATIGETDLSYIKNGRTIVLALPRG